MSTESTGIFGGIDAKLLEESLEDLYEHAPCGYISTLPDGTFAKVNRTFLDWMGYRREELVGRMRLQDLLTVPGKIFHETHYAPLLRMQGSVAEIAFDLVCRDGRQLPVLINSVQKRDTGGTPLLNRTTIFNASDRRDYERELQLARRKAEDALKLRDHFLALASHELKTPVTAILGHLQLLQRRVTRENSLSGRDQRTLQIITGQVERLHRMLLSLLDITRIETGQLSIERAPMDVCALVQRVVDEVQSAQDERLIELQGASGSSVIQGDELRLQEVFLNLITNALKYSAPTTAVCVAVNQHAAQVCVDVRDQGIGIPQADLPHLFERFYRASNVQEGAPGGMGIGLFVVKEIVELHGGQIMVHSVEGQGSTFTVCLPLDSA